MCFSPEADFTASVVVGAVGVGTLRRVRTRRELIVGALVGGYLLWQVTQYAIYAHEQASCINYVTGTPLEIPAAVAYVIATCTPALLYSRRYLRRFGVVNLVGVAIALSVRETELTSVWCLYAALVSVLILEHFRRQRRLERVVGNLRRDVCAP
jgi:hypothetical protein